MTLVIVIWTCTLVMCSIAFLTGLVGGAYLWRASHKKDTESTLIMVIVATVIALGGTITSLFRLIQFLHHSWSELFRGLKSFYITSITQHKLIYVRNYEKIA